MWHLDFARIVCVSCVVVEHSGGQTYSNHNVGFVLQWVLPFLYLTSGTCFMLSSTPTWYYLARLIVLLACGVTANWLSDVATGRDWAGDFGRTVYQMCYVVCLIILALLLAPLRRVLRWRQANPTAVAGWNQSAVALAWGALSGAGVVSLTVGRPLISAPPDAGWAVNINEVLDNSSVVLANTGGIAFFIALAYVMKTTDAFGWVLLAAIYVPRVLMPYNSAGFPHNCELYLFGMATAKLPLQGAAWVSRRVRAYWPLLFAALMLISEPNMTGRCDVQPPDSWFRRLRFYVLECTLVVCFSTGALTTSDPDGVTAWLKQWAVFAFCFHVAFHRMLPDPWGAVLSYSCMVPFYEWHRRHREAVGHMATLEDIEVELCHMRNAGLCRSMGSTLLGPPHGSGEAAGDPPEGDRVERPCLPTHEAGADGDCSA